MLKRFFIIILLFPQAIYAYVNMTSAILTNEGCGCHGGDDFFNFATFSNTTLNANETYEIVLKLPANQIAGQNAFQVLVYDSATFSPIGQFVTDQTGNVPLTTPNSSTFAMASQTDLGLRLLERDGSGGVTTKKYYWKAPSAPPSSISISALIVDSNGNSNSNGDLVGTLTQEIKQSFASSEDGDGSSGSGSNSANGAGSNGSGIGGLSQASQDAFSNLQGGCGLIAIKNDAEDHTKPLNRLASFLICIISAFFSLRLYILARYNEANAKNPHRRR